MIMFKKHWNLVFANSIIFPPLLKIFYFPKLLIMLMLHYEVIVKHGTNPAEELGVYKPSHCSPFEVFIVKRIIIVQLYQVLGQILGSGEAVHMDE